MAKMKLIFFSYFSYLRNQTNIQLQGKKKNVVSAMEQVLIFFFKEITGEIIWKWRHVSNDFMLGWFSLI